MRRLRRSNRSSLTGDPAVDGRNQALVEIIGDMAAKLRSTEHCQDMNVLYDDLVALTEQRLDDAKQGELDASESDDGIRAFMTARMPLPARDGPACRDCGLCEQLEQEVAGWLEDTAA